ncbi:MAG: hypothetical protein ABR562_01145 [Thermoplasmatota archaeon]|nr:hypothetical protein [Halobacteriales archaeon]
MRVGQVALLLIVAFAVSGCASRSSDAPPGGTTSSEGLVPVGGSMTSAAPGASAATANLTKDPVDVQESGDLATGVDKDWDWHVAPGYKTFTVELMVMGPQGAPEYTLYNYDVSLTGGDPSEQVVHDSQSVASGSGTGAGACLACADGEPAGSWTLHWSVEHGVGQWAVHVVVAY